MAHHLQTTTPGALRTRRLVKGIASSAAGKGVGLVAPILLVPITYTYLGAPRYGLWMTVLSLTSMALFADLGMGNGLVTVLSGHLARDQQDESGRVISTAYAILCGQAVLLLVGLVAAVWLVPWSTVFAVDGAVPDGQVQAVAVICLAAFIINMPLSLIQRVQYARQEIAQSNGWQAAAGLASVGVAWVVVVSGGGYLLVVAAVAAAPLVGNLVNSLVWYGRAEGHLRPRLSNVDPSAGRGLARLGVQFLAISVLGTIALGVDQLVAAHVLGLDDAAHFSILARMYAALGLLTGLLCLPLWPANAEALGRGDVTWVRTNTARMVLTVGLIVQGAAVALMLYGQDLAALWTRADASYANQFLLSAFGLTAGLIAVASPLFMVQNAVGLLWPQLIGWVAFLPVSVGLKVVMAGQWGMIGIPLAGSIAYALLILPAALVGYRKALERSP